jgi:hypothetical protein
LSYLLTCLPISLHLIQLPSTPYTWHVGDNRVPVFIERFQFYFLFFFVQDDTKA